MSSKRSKSPIYSKKKGGLLSLPPRRKFRKSPAQQTPRGSEIEKQDVPQQSDHRYAQGEIVRVFFDDRAKQLIGVRPWKYAGAPLSKVSTEGKIVSASSDKATVAFKRPSGSFSARLKGATPMSVNGGIPLFALLNSDFIADDVEQHATKSDRKVGDYITVHLDPISGQPVEEQTIYPIKGRIVKPGTVEIPKTTIKTVVVKGTLPLGKRIELYLDGDKASLKQLSASSVRVPGTVVDSKTGVTTLSYKVPSKASGKYEARYSPTNITGRYVTDPRFMRERSPEAQRAAAMYKPPVPPLCVGEHFNPRDPNSCYIKGMEERLKPILSEKSKLRGTAGANEYCNFSRPKLQAHQMAVTEFARILASRSPKEIDGIRGMLCYHSVGSGKTVTSLGIVLSFWNTTRNIILATTPNNMRDNNPSVYTENLFKFFPDQVKMVFKDRPLPDFTRAPFDRMVTYDGNSMTAERALKLWCSVPANIKPMSSRIKTYSFVTFASFLGFKGSGVLGRSKAEGEALLMGKYASSILPTTSDVVRKASGSVLIMDEVQSMFKPGGAGPDYIASVKWLRSELVKQKYAKRMYVFALTGTPGGTVKDILDVVNFVRPLNIPRMRPQDLNTHPEWLKGFISYVELRNDTSVYGVKTVKNVFAQMDPKYYAAYLRMVAAGRTVTVPGAEVDDVKGKKKISFSESLRQPKAPGYMGLAIGAGDALTTKSSMTGIYTPQEIQNLMSRSMTGGIPAAIMFDGKPIILSPKVRDCINNMLSMKGKQYVYAVNKSTIYALMTALMSIGYSPVTPRNMGAVTSPGKRFMFYKSGSYTFNKKIIKVSEQDLNNMKNVMERKDNINGDYVKIILATETYYQGLSINGLTGVHLLDPLHDAAADIQGIGRALRLCGHAKSASKTVTVFRYFSTIPRTFARDGVSKKQLPELEKIDKEIRRLNTQADFSLTNGGPRETRLPEGVNTFVFADAVRLNKEVAQTERLLKAMAIDCPLYKSSFHSSENFRCGVPTKVDITASKTPISARKLSPTTGLLRLSPLTPKSSSSRRSSSSQRSSSSRRSSSPRRSSSSQRSSGTLSSSRTLTLPRSGTASGSRASGSRASGSRASGSRASGSRASGSRASGSRGSGLRASGSLGSGSRASGSQASGSRASGSRTTSGTMSPGSVLSSPRGVISSPPKPRKFASARF
ncbi:helicase [Acanthocystis turfacea Chlorella virus NE-JV-3]|nr:helicase [Acanthocystis turfacea Chlorella virus NE-JV-3]